MQHCTSRLSQTRDLLALVCCSLVTPLAHECETCLSSVSCALPRKVRALFLAAIESAPCIVFMDEVDAITPKRETSSRGMEKRIVAQVGRRVEVLVECSICLVVWP